MGRDRSGILKKQQEPGLEGTSQAGSRRLRKRVAFRATAMVRWLRTISGCGADGLEGAGVVVVQWQGMVSHGWCQEPFHRKTTGSGDCRMWSVKEGGTRRFLAPASASDGWWCHSQRSGWSPGVVQGQMGGSC